MLTGKMKVWSKTHTAGSSDSGVWKYYNNDWDESDFESLYDMSDVTKAIEQAKRDGFTLGRICKLQSTKAPVKIVTFAVNVKEGLDPINWRVTPLGVAPYNVSTGIVDMSAIIFYSSTSLELQS